VHIAFPFRVHEIVALGRAPHGGAEGTRDGWIIDQALARFDIGHLAERDVTTLSGGERQRAHLARALAQVWDAPADGASRFLLLDEPTASLDPAHQLTALEIQFADKTSHKSSEKLLSYLAQSQKLIVLAETEWPMKSPKN
jgi:iron complex transport system ATP-binding protein